ADREEWARTEWPVAYGHTVGLGGLPGLVIAELLLGLQGRCQLGGTTRPELFRGLVQHARAAGVSSLFDLLATLKPRGYRQVLSTMLECIRCALSSPEQERRHDVWNLRVFGHSGELRFTKIRQSWLRETAKRWAVQDIAKRRGGQVAAAMQSRVLAVRHLSDSLYIQREDHGQDPALLGRRDIENLLHRLTYLQDTGATTARQRAHVCRDLSKIVNDIRDLGLAKSGEPAAGLPESFVIRRSDIPREAKREGPGRALPQSVMRQLYEALSRIEEISTRESRVAVELLMDTGRRPEEICRLRFDCLVTGDDGKYVLIFTDFKNNREERRLPITNITAGVIRDQQQAVRKRFPDTSTSDLPLLPRKLRNPDGTQPLTVNGLTNAHRRWVALLPPLLLPDGAEFDRTAIALYPYRHSYAQRHADAGTPADVLRDLMSHRSIATTQIYYRVTEKRVRGAVDKLVEFQFDRHGNRIWPEAKALLDHEYARMRVGSVAVPFGTCSEPSNVTAGGHACPFRFRCLGCEHFRTDPSFLPELRDYLQTLLRDRERIQAATELDSWAAAEATPSEEEISRLRALIRLTEQSVDDLTAADRAALEEATKALRKVRQTVDLGMPSVAPPHRDPRLERDS
ncbi:tyrosine-type recombinase/integrase, partial [Saccharopolyspora shandongensis]|uniref:tyrosine-type recombinase/integrase n=1 Tax=Saccharopolyspora shandongensis TaxID=418495 RepID=UPI0034430FCB